MKTLVLNGNIRRVPEGGSQGTGLSLEETALELGKVGYNKAWWWRSSARTEPDSMTPHCLRGLEKSGGFDVSEREPRRQERSQEGGSFP